MAFSGSGATSAFGPVLNPHNPEHLAGGSSAGSGAALYYGDMISRSGRPGGLDSHPVIVLRNVG